MITAIFNAVIGLVPATLIRFVFWRQAISRRAALAWGIVIFVILAIWVSVVAAVEQTTAYMGAVVIAAAGTYWILQYGRKTDDD